MLKRKQITFDIDTNVAKQILGEKNYTNVYAHIRSFMNKRNWIHIEGSVYVSKMPMSNIKTAHLVNDLKNKYPYLNKCIREMHQSDISNVHSLSHCFEYDGTTGKFAQIQSRKSPKNISVLDKLAQNKEIVQQKNNKEKYQPRNRESINEL